MAAFKIFYAWQSDRPANLCRSLIRNALDDAAKKFQDGLEIDDERCQVEIDQDTQGDPVKTRPHSAARMHETGSG